MQSEVSSSSKTNDSPSSSRFDVEKVCRLCIHTLKNEHELLENVASLATFRKMTQLELNHDDALPEHVCKSCIKQMDLVEKASKFMQKCRQYQNALVEFVAKEKESNKSTGVQEAIPSNSVESSAQVLPGCLIEPNSLNSIKKSDRGVLRTYSQKAKESNRRIVLVPLKAIAKCTHSQEETKASTSSQPSPPEKNSITAPTTTEDSNVKVAKKAPVQAKSSGTIVTNWSKLRENLVEATDEDGKPILFQVVKKKRTLKRKKEEPTKYSKRLMMCEICGALTKSLTRHKRLSFNCASKCDECDFVTVHKKYLRSHIETAHPKENTKPRRRKGGNPNATVQHPERHFINVDGKLNVIYRCSMCDLVVDDIRKHRRDNPACWYKCDVCDFRNFNQFKVRTHKLVVHLGHRFTCKTCDRKFRSPEILRGHRKLHCSGSGPVRAEFSCDFCNRKFLQFSSYERHIDIHTKEEPYKCKYCDLKFQSPVVRKKHMDEAHKAIMLELGKCCLCEVCGKEYETKAKLGVHLRTHSPELVKCDQCSYQTYQKSYMKAHKMTHTGEKPHKCLICGASFRLSGRLITHMRKHLDLKKFACKICPKRFIHKHHCDEHQLRHTRTKPFPCHACNKRFYTVYWRKRHVIKKHGQEEVENIGKSGSWKIEAEEAVESEEQTT